MVDLVNNFVRCASELYDAYKGGDWPSVIEHVGHILTHAAEFWKVLNLKSDSSSTLTDEDESQFAATEEKLMELQSELELGTASDGYETSALNPHFLLVVVQLAIEIIHALKNRS